ncbi:hypothetical protein OS12_42910 [Dickeya oryzae]
MVAQLSGKDAVAGAVGAAGGELTARLLIMKELYGGRDTSDLTEAEKQSVSALASLAAGLASGDCIWQRRGRSDRCPGRA